MNQLVYNIELASFNLYIGLYKAAGINTMWQWLDGTSTSNNDIAPSSPFD